MDLEEKEKIHRELVKLENIDFFSERMVRVAIQERFGE